MKYLVVLCFVTICACGHLDISRKGWRYLNILFAIDGSFERINKSYLNRNKFIKSIVNHTAASVNDGSTKIGVLQFGFFPQMRMHIRSDFSWKVMRNVDRIIPRYGRNVRLGKALRLAGDTMNHLEYQNTPKLMIIIIHSQATDSYIYPLKIIQKSGISVMFIDVGGRYKTCSGVKHSYCLRKEVEGYYNLHSYNNLSEIVQDVYTQVKQTADIDECKRHTNNCSVNANCTNRNKGYSCVCHAGWLGDGRHCWPTTKNYNGYGKTIKIIRPQLRQLPKSTNEQDESTRRRLQRDASVMFVVGLSSQLTRNDFQNAKDLIVKVATNLTTKISSGDYTLRIGVGSFYYVSKTIALLNKWDMNKLSNKLLHFQYRQGLAFMGAAIHNFNTYMLQTGVTNPASNLMVVITTGESFDDAEPALAHATQSGTKFLFVRIGNFSTTLPQQNGNVSITSSLQTNNDVQCVARQSLDMILLLLNYHSNFNPVLCD